MKQSITYHQVSNDPFGPSENHNIVLANKAFYRARPIDFIARIVTKISCAAFESKMFHCILCVCALAEEIENIQFSDRNYVEMNVFHQFLIAIASKWIENGSFMAQTAIGLLTTGSFIGQCTKWMRECIKNYIRIVKWDKFSSSVCVSGLDVSLKIPFRRREKCSHFRVIYECKRFFLGSFVKINTIKSKKKLLKFVHIFCFLFRMVFPRKL